MFLVDSTVWLITYKGQTESPYKWVAHGLDEAFQRLGELEKQYPDRLWSICEKDVS